MLRAGMARKNPVIARVKTGESGGCRARPGFEIHRRRWRELPTPLKL
jgi:hypothetical protein